ncbi:O-linked N-acetylglucosamine transferase, SPINDLY family protein [Desulfatitalea tepidiphila]|uniref:O-linked N-acetylglucosamine transferase, SPINDLY family protein n=1 Tax=Desulfatitalea tepidiphila TaxID=1185843 RepID=UPI003F76CF1E
MTSEARSDGIKNWKEAYEKGRLACASGDLHEASMAIETAIRLNPNAFELHHDLGVVFFQQNSYHQALTCFRSAIALNPRKYQAWFNGANALCAMHCYQEAIPWYRKAIELNPSFAEAHYNLANTYKALDAPHEAILHYRRAMDIDPNMPEALNNIGTLLLGCGELIDARECFQRALASDANYTQASYNLSLTLNRLGRPEEAIAFVDRCLGLYPEHGEGLALRVSLLQQVCDWPALADAGARLDRQTDEQLRLGQRPSESPFLNFTRSDDPERNLLIGKAWSDWLLKHANHSRSNFGFSHRPQATRRIKIAYLSERFRNAATAHLASGVFGRHDRNRFEIYAYSWGQDDGSVYRRKIEQGVDHFIDIRNISDAEAAQRIHADGIQILVDMMGWMHGHRMGIAARRPAPVQINYLGYPASTGTPFIDYLIADRIIIPYEMRQYFSEKVVWLPDCYQPNDPETPIDPRPCSRIEFGLPENGVIFCSFNTDYKIEPGAFACWMRILRAVPGSVLWLLVRSQQARENLIRSAGSLGIAPTRLVFASPLPKAKHLARLKLADIALDTLTVNGHTTTTDALLAGVPVVTCQGRHFASRVAGSILSAIRMPDLVAADMESYVQMAITLASEAHLLDEVRARLANNKTNAPLFDIDRYVRNLEAAYDNVWKTCVTEKFQRA